jgi:hypothetical protein
MQSGPSDLGQGGMAKWVQSPGERPCTGAHQKSLTVYLSDWLLAKRQSPPFRQPLPVRGRW